MEIFGRAGLIDLFFLIICLRIFYISISRGFLSESFKILGLLSGSFFAFQYYFFIGGILSKRIPFLHPESFYFIAFLLILLGIGIIFSFLRIIVTFLFKKKERSFTEKGLSFLIGGLRASFFISVIIFLLHLLPFNSLYFRHTLSYDIFKNIAPKFYLVSFNLYKKIIPIATLNKEVEEYYGTKKTLSRDNKERN